MQARILPQQIQKTILAPVMQQSIEVLLLAVTELNLSIEQELQSNPLLEINEEAPAAQDPGLKEKRPFTTTALCVLYASRCRDNILLMMKPSRIFPSRSNLH